MKIPSISIGSHIVNGPWGGGNQFAVSLSHYLEKQGWQVHFDLKPKNLDIILLIEPRKALRISTFNHIDIAKYVLKNPETIVVHRINECDERKGTSGVNALLMRANEVADHTIFISSWLKSIFSRYKNFPNHNASMIQNGGDPSVFNRKNYKVWDKHTPLKIVTHHWGGNWMKGFDIYQDLDNQQPVGVGNYAIEFTYIGNVPQDFTFKHATHLPPQSGVSLAQAIQEHHVYISGSQNEPAGMHHIEACLCGLPIAYRESGALPEYCHSFGYGFTGANDYQQAILSIIDHYNKLLEANQHYPYTSLKMCKAYEALFQRLLNSESLKKNKLKTMGQQLRILAKEKFLKNS